MRPPKAIKTSLPFNRFAAIDFETADYGRDSACALAVVVGEAGSIVKKKYSLIRPPRRDFIFTYVHGISWNDVCDAPFFNDVWPQFADLFDDVDFIAAHNASFDRAVLTTCCDKANVAAPAAKYLCSMKLARRQWGLFPTKLSDVCTHFNIPLQHHDAASDALACAEIVLQAWETGVPSTAFMEDKR